MFLTYFRSAMNVRQQPYNDIEEQSSMVSPSSTKGIIGNLDHRRPMISVLPSPINTEDECGMNTSMSSLRGSTADLVDTSRSTTTQLKPQIKPLQATRGLPLTNKNVAAAPEPKLLHPFGLNGILSNVLVSSSGTQASFSNPFSVGQFMFIYNWCVVLFEKKLPVTTIYAAVYLFYIPLNHFLVSILVFGWPEHYLGSLMNNFPIGLTAIALGSLLTAYLDRLEFSKQVDEFVFENLTFSRMPPRVPSDESKSEFWSSLAVLVVTSLWTYILSIFVNRAPAKSDKKEL